jgi:hypothetical protein
VGRLKVLLKEFFEEPEVFLLLIFLNNLFDLEKRMFMVDVVLTVLAEVKVGALDTLVSDSRDRLHITSFTVKSFVN